MRRFIATLFLLFFPFLMSYSQVKEGNNFEAGGIYAFAFGRANDGSKYNISGPGAYFEYRNEYECRLYLGARFDYRFAKGPGHEYDLYGIRYNTNYNQFCIKGLCGYNFCPERVVDPFVGFGLGGGLLYTHRVDNNNFIDLSLIATPSVGVQIYRFRLSCDLDLFCGDWYGRTDFSIGSLVSRGRRYYLHTTVISLNLGFRF